MAAGYDVSGSDIMYDCMLLVQGLRRQYSAFHVLQSVEVFFSSSGASCKLDATSFKIDVCSFHKSYLMLLTCGLYPPNLAC